MAPRMELRKAMAAGLLWCALAPASATVLRIAAQEGTEPKYIADRQQVVGLCVDILRAVEQVDPDLRFSGDQHWLPQIRSYAEVSAGRLDVLCGIQHTPERDQQYLFLEPPLFPIEYHLIARADDPVNIGDWDDVRRLGAQGVVLSSRNYATTTILAQLGGLQIDAAATNPLMNLHKLVSGRGRFFLHRSTGLQAFLDRNELGGKVRILPAVMYNTRLYMALGRHVDAAVAARLHRALDQLDKTGELNRLRKKWD